MAIRDIVLRGYGNGTFSPGVGKVPTRGYSIAEVITTDGLFFTDVSINSPQFTTISIKSPSFADVSIGSPSFENVSIQ